MPDNDTDLDLDLKSIDNGAAGARGGFVALAVLAAALGAGAALMLAPEEGARTRERVGRGLRSLRGEAAETIGQLQHEIRKRRRQSRREKRIVAFAGLLIGVGVTALLIPESGAATRKRLGGTLSRIKVGAVDRIERLRQRQGETAGDRGEEPPPVRSVQELGRDPNDVF
jgi:gas vesicle protein